MKKQVEELVNLEKRLSNSFQWIMPFAFLMAAFLMFLSALFRRMEHQIFPYIMGIIGGIVLFYEIKDRKKVKKRIKELRGQL